MKNINVKTIIMRVKNFIKYLTCVLLITGNVYAVDLKEITNSVQATNTYVASKITDKIKSQNLNLYGLGKIGIEIVIKNGRKIPTCSTGDWC